MADVNPYSVETPDMVTAILKRVREKGLSINPNAKNINAEQLISEWRALAINDFDYGKLKDTNPLAFLGSVNTPRKNIGTFTTPLTASGLTVTDTPNDPIVKNALKEAKLPQDKNAKGDILLGPEFANAPNNFTLEHELMHKGMGVIHQKEPKSNLEAMNTDEEIILRIIGALKGQKDDLAFLDENTNVDTKKLKSAQPAIADLMNKAQEFIKKQGY